MEKVNIFSLFFYLEECCFVCLLYTKVAVDTFYRFCGYECDSCCACTPGNLNQQKCVTNPNIQLCKSCVNNGCNTDNHNTKDIIEKTMETTKKDDNKMKKKKRN